jgi:hypothetical protein
VENVFLALLLLVALLFAAAMANSIPVGLAAVMLYLALLIILYLTVLLWQWVHLRRTPRERVAERPLLIQAETGPPTADITLWQLIIGALAFCLPILDGIVEAYPDSLFGRAYLSLEPLKHETRPDISGFWFVPIEIVWANWPFFVLAACVKHTFRNHRSNVKAAHAAVMGGLIGLLTPYIWFYATLPIASLYNTATVAGDAYSFASFMCRWCGF